MLRKPCIVFSKNGKYVSNIKALLITKLNFPQIREHVTPLEIMASLIGAVAHDLDHPGVNQHFLISTSNHLAILYDVRITLDVFAIETYVLIF